MRSPKLFGPVAVAVLTAVALFPPAPAVAQHGHVSEPSQSFEPPPPSPPPEPPPPPPPPAPAPEPPSAPPPSAQPEPSAPPSAPPSVQTEPSEPPRTPTDPGTVGRQIPRETPSPDARPTDPGTVGRHIPAAVPEPPPLPPDDGEPPSYWYWPDGSPVGDMTTFAEAPPPEAMATLVEKLYATLVEVQVFVSDPKGKPVTGLKKDDFLLFVDGEAIPIESFYAQTASAAPGTDRAVLERLVGLSTFYSLAFAPAHPGDGRPHRIAVVVKGRPGLTVRASERQPPDGG